MTDQLPVSRPLNPAIGGWRRDGTLRMTHERTLSKFFESRSTTLLADTSPATLRSAAESERNRMVY